MSGELGDELAGLPRAILETLVAHPEWTRSTDTGRVICAGKECDWVKPSGKSITQRWLKHQSYELQCAIADWYYNNT